MKKDSSNQYKITRDKQKTQPKHFLRKVHIGIKNRCDKSSSKNNMKYYYGKEYCTRDEFIDKFINDSNFLKLFKEWQKSDFLYDKTPSVDRINNEGDYTLDNMQFLTVAENSGKDKEKLPILMYDLKNNFIREWESKWQAHKELGIPNGNICKVVYGLRRSAGGYRFKFKNT